MGDAVSNYADRWSEDESPRQLPMRAGIKPANQKAPSNDQKKVRRELQRKTAEMVEASRKSYVVTSPAGFRSYHAKSPEHAIEQHQQQHPGEEVYDVQEHPLAHAATLQSEATQLSTTIAAPDGRVLVNSGDHMRLPTGQTVKIHQVRQRPGYIGQYYLDTDMGTSLVNHDHQVQLVPHETRSQALPSYADSRGNTNALPGGVERAEDSGTALHGDTCSVCGSHNAMVSKGNRAVCSKCGYSTTTSGSMTFGDAAHIYGNPKVSSTMATTAVARHAAEVYELMKENPL